jgi:murein DD-endopeptidase MepM/ murein hydrolase activator NlpD
VLAQLHDQAANLQAELSARQDAADQLAQVQAQDQQRLAEAEQSAKELDAQIQELQAEAAAAARRGGGNGHFVWPESGPITQGFGCTPYQFEPWDPNCPSHHFHTGIDIGAAWGTPVGAGDAGIAHTYVSSYGYGNHVIIVHGNGWVSIYGHLASFAVSDGQAVARGQTIGYEGSTGNSTGPHLHFEIRLNDVPQNPLQYLP